MSSSVKQVQVHVGHVQKCYQQLLPSSMVVKNPNQNISCGSATWTPKLLVQLSSTELHGSAPTRKPGNPLLTASGTSVPLLLSILHLPEVFALLAPTTGLLQMLPGFPRTPFLGT